MLELKILESYLNFWDGIEKEIVLIDTFIDDTILTLFSKYPNIKLIGGILEQVDG